MRVVIALLLFPFALFCQQEGDYSISGVVLNEQTGEPVKGALVTLTSFPAFEPGQQRRPVGNPLQKTILSGGVGEFQFNGLAKGRCDLRAIKNGFDQVVSLKHPGMQQATLTSSLSGIQLKLSPLGVIEGKVTDQNGEPLRGVNIVALEANVNDGIRETTSARSVATDDRGVYRLWNLRPAPYYIKAAGKSGGTYRYIGDATPYYSSWQSFAPTYSGGAHTIDSATPVRVEYGSKMQADLQLTLEPAFKIRGTVIGAPPGALTFEMIQGSEDVSASRTSMNASTGAFEVQDVTPGSYLLRVTQENKVRGSTQVTVTGGDVNGVSISLAPSVTVHVRKHLAGPPPDQKPEAADTIVAITGPGRSLGPSCVVILRPEGGGTPGHSAAFLRSMPSTTNQETGETAIENVLPGVYRVGLECFGGYPVSLLAADVDLLTTPKLLVTPGAGDLNIDLQMNRGGGTLVTSVDIRPLPEDGGLLLVPLFGNSSGPLMIPISQQFQTREITEFRQQFLAPGDYTVHAFSNRTEIEFRDPKFLQTLSGGLSVHIEDGKEAKISITKLSK